MEAFNRALKNGDVTRKGYLTALHSMKAWNAGGLIPAINLSKSGTRREEKLVPQDELQRMWVLRKLLHSMDDLAAMELLIDRMKQTKTNAQFFESMKR